mmetsp:Transcript_30642/g.46393  ORF Transcript_30642/g.46393 Transcript_30642/m.46393 type:complete len:115 (+) Transcript_30642:2125-2469(+)
MTEGVRAGSGKDTATGACKAEGGGATDAESLVDTELGCGCVCKGAAAGGLCGCESSLAATEAFVWENISESALHASSNKSFSLPILLSLIWEAVGSEEDWALAHFTLPAAASAE